MAKSLRQIVEEGVIVSDEMYGAFLKSVERGHVHGGVPWSMPLNVEDCAVQSAPQIYSRLDSVGKQQICVRFQSGAIQILATEP